MKSNKSPETPNREGFKPCERPVSKENALGEYEARNELAKLVIRESHETPVYWGGYAEEIGFARVHPVIRKMTGHACIQLEKRDGER